MHSDVKMLDPVWSGAYITRNHGYMIYDTLFAIDEKLQVKPQMVDSWTTSDDGLTWTFKLRDGLEWHDGTPVTSEDCVASLKRWAARDSMGQKLALSVQDYKVVDPKTFQIVLKEKFGPLLEALGKPSVVVPFMMPKKTSPRPTPSSRSTTTSAPVRSSSRRTSGSPARSWSISRTPSTSRGPSRCRASPAARWSSVDRVEWVWIPDAETQLNALLSGEIDMLESVSYDHLPVLEKNKDVRVITSTHLQPVRLPHELAAAAVQQREDPPGRHLCAEPGGIPAGQHRRQALLSRLQGDVHLRHAARHRRRHGRADRGQCRQGTRAAEGGGLRRHGRGDPAADRPRRHQAAARPSPRRSSRRPASRSRSSRWTGRAW